VTVTLHPLVLADLLAAEADVARERLGARLDDLVVAPDHVTAVFRAHDRSWCLRLDAGDYDARPLAVSIVVAGVPVGREQWPPGLAYESVPDHPVLHRPWVCLRGTLEYHSYPGHTADGWELSRADLRMADVLDHLLRNAGA
jgi:hypothetical protein